MNSFELRNKFFNFFEKRGHKIVPSSSLIPEDKTVLLTTAGMQQFIPYLSGQKDATEDFGGKTLASIQKCFRTNDIEEVGDDTHHTFFEMLGNWSIGGGKNGYFKEGAIGLALDFLLKELGLEKERIWVTIFSGEGSVPKDNEAAEIWEKKGIPRGRILEFGSEDNFWGPVSDTGPCGPCSEIHYDRGEKFGCKDCGPNCDKCNRFVEIWNLVFMEYDKKEDGSLKKLPQKNVDTGIGFERVTALLQGKKSAFETDLFDSIIKKLEEVSGKDYKENTKAFRVIADHARGGVFLISDNILPSNTERGYILRRVLRRAIRLGKVLKMPDSFLVVLAQEVINKFGEAYPELKLKEKEILNVIQKEQDKFEKTLERGLKEFDKIGYKKISGKEAFRLYESYGFPLELTKELAEEKEIEIVQEEDFEKALKKHKEISRAGVEKKFGGVGREAGYQEAKLHTATHLLHQALREVLGKEVKQMGSDVNSERLRFDFSYNFKMTDEEINKVEDIVNEKIKEDLKVEKKEMSLKKALDSGALAFFKEKYPDKVNVYSVGSFSKEICAGPHAKKTSELGRFKIIKEKSSGAGIRRIRAVLE